MGTGGDTNDTLDNIFNGVACARRHPRRRMCPGQHRRHAVAVALHAEVRHGRHDPQGSFFEGGVNLSALGLDIGCGAGFLAETRSSQSVDAQLKDFAGRLRAVRPGSDQGGRRALEGRRRRDYEFTIENTGSVTLFKDSIIDDVIGDITDNVGLPAISNYVSNCGASLAAGASCTITLTYTIQAGDPDPLVNTVTATYNSEADFSGSDVADTDDHSTNLFQPVDRVTRRRASLSKVGDDVHYVITITNTSSADSPTSSSTDRRHAPGRPARRMPGSARSRTTAYRVRPDRPCGRPGSAREHGHVETHPEGFPNDIDDAPRRDQPVPAVVHGRQDRRRAEQGD